MAGRVTEFEDVVVVGCGGIGLAVAVAFASRGVRVLGVDIDAALVERLGRGALSLLEEGLDEALAKALANGTIRFAATIDPARGPRAFILAVPTPADDRGFDPRPLGETLNAVKAVAAAGDLVCIRSTAPIGAARALAAMAPQLRFAACPDRSIAGRALPEQFSVPHLVGGLDEASASAAEALFGVLGQTVRLPDPESAEAAKLFANIERDVTFALANQFARVCEAAGVDMASIRAAGAHDFPRFRLARPGPVGGPCLSKDLHVLAASPALAGEPLTLLRAARDLNAGLAEALAGRIAADLAAAPGPVAILGLAFKGAPPTRDVRQGFGGRVMEALASICPGAELRSWDPVLGDAAGRRLALDGACVVVLANDHPDLAKTDDWSERLWPGAVVYDTAGLLSAVPPGLVLRRFGDGRRV